MKFAGAIFDQDGLLFDTETIYGKCWKKAGEEFGIAVTDAYHASLCGRGRREVIERARETFPGLDAEAFVERALQLSAAMQLSGVPEVKLGAREILQSCREYGIGTAVASSSTRRCVEHNLRVSGLIDYFDAVVTGEQVVKGKPAPDIFLLAAERLGLPPSECVVFEDAPSGILAAKAAGCLPVMVPDRVRPDAAIRAICRVYPSLAAAQQALLPPV